MRNKETIDLVQEVQGTASSKNAGTVAKIISNKYKKMRSKRPLLPFNLNDLAEEESIVYNDDRNMNDVRLNNNANIAANRISKKYKKVRAKNFNLPFRLEEIEEAETEKHNNDTDLADVNLNINAAVAAKKICDKYKKICRKRKRDAPIEPMEGPPKRPKTIADSKRLTMLAAKRISGKYKKLHNK